MTARRAITSLILRMLRLAGPGRKPPLPDFVPARVAVMRYGGFGDVLAVTSLVRAIRKRWPDARIDFITDAASTLVLENNDDIDDVVVTPKLRLGANPRTILENIARVRDLSREPYDVAFITHHPIEFQLLALFFRAQYRVGFDINERGFDFPFTHAADVYTAPHPKAEAHLAGHFTQHYQKLLQAFTGDEAEIERPHVALADDELARARAFVEAKGIARNLVIVAPGGSVPVKLWPMDRFAEVVRRLRDRHDVSVMVMVGPDEAHHADLFAGLDERVLFDAGGNSFRENMAIVKLADAMIGNDTGLMHVAAAFGVPGVAIFGPTPAAVFGYAHLGHRILTADLPCVPCNELYCRLLPDRGHGAVAPCLDAIGPDGVMAAFDAATGPAA